MEAKKILLRGWLTHHCRQDLSRWIYISFTVGFRLRFHPQSCSSFMGVNLPPIHSKDQIVILRPKKEWQSDLYYNKVIHDRLDDSMGAIDTTSSKHHIKNPRRNFNWKKQQLGGRIMSKATTSHMNHSWVLQHTFPRQTSIFTHDIHMQKDFHRMIGGKLSTCTSYSFSYILSTRKKIRIKNKKPHQDRSSNEKDETSKERMCNPNKAAINIDRYNKYYNSNTFHKLIILAPANITRM